MSGIVGIVHFAGAPVDRHLLGRMTSFMALRGPDAQEIWVDSTVGLGRALLRTTDEADHERQPFTLDGQVWIVADARVDARSELISQLHAHGHGDLRSYSEATDVELILRAYQTWNEDCVNHLLGDFAFAIWDGPRQRLFCGRDHLGVKPFFYARVGETLIFSSSLDCIRQHPGVSDRLNDMAIADFLLFDRNQNPAATSFADIQRLPPAHVATWAADGMQLRRYWRFPIDEPVYFRKDDDYVDRFTELLEQAVDDRLRTKKIGVFMSGGLDSPAMTATACRILRNRSADFEVRAFTTVIDGADCDERYYAGSAARYLGIPIHFRDLTGRTFDPDWEDSGVHTPEPVSSPMNLLSDRREYRAMAEHSRVWFYGEGPDNALRHEWRVHFSSLIRRRQASRLAKDAWESVIRSRQVPFVARLALRLRRLCTGKSERSVFPEWLQPDFTSRLQLRARWEEHDRLPSDQHSYRPEAYRLVACAPWPDLFSRFDPEITGVASECRHPWLDMRLLRYLLSVPVVPWCREKYLVRRAMLGQLPAAVLRRPKAPLAGDPQWKEMQSLGTRTLKPSGELAAYVDVLRLRNRAGRNMNSWADFRPRALNHWLRNLRPESRTASDGKLSEKNHGEILRAAS